MCHTRHCGLDPQSRGATVKSFVRIRIKRILGFTGFGRCVASFYGYCLKASMTATLPLWFPAYAGMTVMRYGNDGVGMLGMTVRWDCLAITLTFDSSPIKGEGVMRLVWYCCHSTLHLWIADQVRNDGMRRASASSSFPPTRE